MADTEVSFVLAFPGWEVLKGGQFETAAWGIHAVEGTFARAVADLAWALEDNRTICTPRTATVRRA